MPKRRRKCCYTDAGRTSNLHYVRDNPNRAVCQECGRVMIRRLGHAITYHNSQAFGRGVNVQDRWSQWYPEQPYLIQELP